MAIPENAREVIQRPLDRGRVKSRQGGQGMSFDYIPTEYAIELLNEAFDYAWDSRVFFHEKLDDCVIVGVELKIWEDQGNPIVKQQFGSCKINRGVDVGSAFKGAASDGLKKCASQFGLALELYRDDDPEAVGGFKPPKRTTPPPARPAPAPPARPSAPAAPRPPAERETRVVPPSGPGSGRPSPPPPASKPNPFAGTGAANSAPLPRPAAPPAPPPPPKSASAAASPRPNPFGGNSTGRGINSTQLSALNSLATKKGVAQPDLIALAQVMDEQGHPKQTFEELTHSEAIQVIKAAQK